MEKKIFRGGAVTRSGCCSPAHLGRLWRRWRRLGLCRLLLLGRRGCEEEGQKVEARA